MTQLRGLQYTHPVGGGQSVVEHTAAVHVAQVEDHIARLRQVDDRLELLAERIRRCTHETELFRCFTAFHGNRIEHFVLAVVIGLPQAVETDPLERLLVEPLVVLAFRGVTRAGQRLQHLEVFAVGAALHTEIIVVDLAHRFPTHQHAFSGSLRREG